MNVNLLVRRLALFGVLLAFTVVVLGAWVRLTDAGLGCPDWPTCYGHITPTGAAANVEAAQARYPEREFDHQKAWHEMIHRYAATTLGLIIVLLAALAIAYRAQSLLSVRYAVLLLLTVVLQGVLGAFTVWWLVKPLVVMLHLAGGLTTMGMLYWLWLELRRRAGLQPAAAPAAVAAVSKPARQQLWLAARCVMVVGCLQILLGGWTSSNYAAVSCPDLPTCQGAWWPAEMDYADAFVLWRGLDIDYTGGVLEHPARVAIHFTHRLGAVVTTLAILWAAWLTFAGANPARLRAAGGWLLAALATQVLIGIFMVWRGFPLVLAAGHNAGAALLLLAMLTFAWRVREIAR